MARSEVNHTFAFTGGFLADGAVGIPSREDALIPPSKNVLYTTVGSLRSFYGVAPIGTLVPGTTFRYEVDQLGSSVRFPFGSSGGAAGLGAQETALGYGRGSAFIYSGKVLFYVGQGALMFAGKRVGVSASSQLQIFVPGDDGTYDIGASGAANYTAGLEAPAPPILASTGSGDITGVYSVKATLLRTVTGAESSPSEASNTIDFTSQQAIVQFTNAISEGYKYRLYVTLATFGATGPWYFYREIEPADLGTVGPYTNAIQLNIQDKDIDVTTTVPTDNQLPPEGLFAFPSRDVICIAGVNDGTQIAVSLPLNPEAFPADYLLDLPEPPTGVLPEPSSGAAFISCRSSLHLARYTGVSSGPPVEIVRIWAAHGIADQRAMCLVGSDVYGFTREGAVRTITGSEAGEPDVSFAVPVRAYMAGWKPEGVRVGFNPTKLYVAFAHGHEVLLYHLDSNRWSALIDLRQYLGDCTVANFHSYQNRLYMDWFTRRDNNYYKGVKYALPGITSSYYFATEFDVGNARVYSVESTTGSNSEARSIVCDASWQVYTDWTFGGAPVRKTLTTMQMVCESDRVEYGLHVNVATAKGYLEEWATEIYQRAVSSTPLPSFVTNTVTDLLHAAQYGASGYVVAAAQAIRDLFVSTDYTQLATTNTRFAQDVHYTLYGAEPTYTQLAAIEALLGTLSRSEVLDRELASNEFEERQRWIWGRFTTRSNERGTGFFNSATGRQDRILEKINVKNAMTFQAFIRGNGRDAISAIQVQGVASPARTKDTSQTVACPTTGTIGVSVGEVVGDQATVTFTIASPNAEWMYLARQNTGELLYFGNESEATVEAVFPLGSYVAVLTSGGRGCSDVVTTQSFDVVNLTPPVCPTAGTLNISEGAASGGQRPVTFDWNVPNATGISLQQYNGSTYDVIHTAATATGTYIQNYVPGDYIFRLVASADGCDDFIINEPFSVSAIS